jgi:hypothetical protein
VWRRRVRGEKEERKSGIVREAMLLFFVRKRDKKARKCLKKSRKAAEKRQKNIMLIP